MRAHGRRGRLNWTLWWSNALQAGGSDRLVSGAGGDATEMQPITAAIDEMADDAAAPGPTATHSTGGLLVSLLGSMVVEFDGQPLHVAGRQRRRLLALLASRPGRDVAADALIDAMWGDDPPPSAAKTVQSHVVRLRQSLAAAGDAIQTRPVATG